MIHNVITENHELLTKIEKCDKTAHSSQSSINYYVNLEKSCSSILRFLATYELADDAPANKFQFRVTGERPVTSMLSLRFQSSTYSLCILEKKNWNGSKPRMVREITHTMVVGFTGFHGRGYHWTGWSSDVFCSCVVELYRPGRCLLQWKERKLRTASYIRKPGLKITQ